MICVGFIKFDVAADVLCMKESVSFTITRNNFPLFTFNTFLHRLPSSLKSVTFPLCKY